MRSALLLGRSRNKQMTKMSTSITKPSASRMCQNTAAQQGQLPQTIMYMMQLA